MAKRDNNRDETPIIWAVPGFRKGPRAPIPLNQPHWIYKDVDLKKPTIGSIVASVIFGLMMLSIVGFSFRQLYAESQIWFAKLLLVVLFGVGVYGWGLWVLQQAFLYKRSQEKDHSPQNKPEKKKKYPKRRKDYQ